MVRKHLLKSAKSFSLEKKPFSIKKLFDLLQIIKDAFIQLGTILQKFVIFQEADVLADNSILSHDSKF